MSTAMAMAVVRQHDPPSSGISEATHSGGSKVSNRNFLAIPWQCKSTPPMEAATAGSTGEGADSGGGGKGVGIDGDGSYQRRERRGVGRLRGIYIYI